MTGIVSVANQIAVYINLFTCASKSRKRTVCVHAIAKIFAGELLVLS